MKMLAVMVLLGVLHFVCAIVYDAEMPKEVENAKGKVDDAQMNDEQFYRCFSDINCNLGPETKDRMFVCYNKVRKEELNQYTKWFADCPHGNFVVPDMLAINEEFCKLDYDEQTTVNKCFGEKMTLQLEEYCKQIENMSKCARLQSGWRCTQKLMDEKIRSKECETAAGNIPTR